MSSWWIDPSAGVHRPAVALAVLALSAAALAHLLFTGWVRRRTRSGADAAHGAREAAWLPRGLRAVASPVALLIWLQGVSMAAQALAPSAAVPGPIGQAAAWAYRLTLVGGLCWLLHRVGALVDQQLAALAARTANGWDDVLLPVAGAAARRGLPLMGVVAAAPLFAASPLVAGFIGTATSLLVIGLVSFVFYQAVDALAAFVLRQHRVDTADNLQARSIVTQVAVLKKVAVAAIAIVTAASMLMVFDGVRQFGASILASAGIAGIVVGFAAQRSLATLLAGFQIAVTQPIRVDDVVIVEGEWGRIEDITLTYVVVRVWDLRRLVVPITHFLERPFQNWTRTSADILGTVFLYVDYTMPIQALRDELTRILESSSRWDGKVNVLQVTDATDRTLEVRALASAADASQAWDLRCEVRERLVTFLRDQHPACLPRLRASVDTPTGSPPGR